MRQYARAAVLLPVLVLSQAVGVERPVYDCTEARAYLGANVYSYFEALPTFEQGFRPLVPDDKVVMNKALARFEPNLSVYTFANFWAWTEPYEFGIIRYEGAMILKAAKEPPSTYHSLFEPLGVPHERRAQIIRDFLRDHPTAPDGKPYVFRHLSAETARELEHDGTVLARRVEGKDEYVYDSSSLGTLHDLRQRRQNVRNFFKQFPDKGESARSSYVSLHELSPEERKTLIPQLHKFLDEWIVDRRGNERTDFAHEIQGTRQMLDHFDEMEMAGGAILVDGKVVAFTLGKKVNPSTLVVYSEKAEPNIGGGTAPTYQAINQRFALDMVKHSLKENEGAGTKTALAKVELWEETEGLTGLSVAEAVRVMKESGNLEPVRSSSIMSLNDAMGRWKALGGDPKKVFESDELRETWAALKLWGVQQAIKGLEKRGIPQGEDLSTSKNPDAVALAKAIEALRDFRLQEVNLALDKVEGTHLRFINRQEHGGDSGHQGAKERYSPLRMEESWLVQSKEVPAVGIDVFEDEQ